MCIFVATYVKCQHALVEVQINDIKFERGIRIVHHIEKQLSPAATLFLNTLKDATTFSG